jgi:hypothetical protein
MVAGVDFFELKRTFVERERYDEAELVESQVRGRSLSWSQLLESPVSIIVAPANAGKSMELEHRAKQIRTKTQGAFFVPLRAVLDRGSLASALLGTEASAFEEWKTSGSASLTLFIDSLDEASTGRRDSVIHLIQGIATELRPYAKELRWVISTRPAVLNARILAGLASALLGDSPAVIDLLRSPDIEDEESGTVRVDHSGEGAKGHIRLFSMVPLDWKQAEHYLRSKDKSIDASKLLQIAQTRGLGGFTKSPGGLDILRHTDILVRPPACLTDFFSSVVQSLSKIRQADVRMEDVGLPDAQVLEDAICRLAAASVVCQVVNIEMPDGPLEKPKNAISARDILSASVPSDKVVSHLLNSQLFLDSAYNQVKLYPDELLPFLAAQRFSKLVQHPDQAHKLLEHFGWTAPSGEKGIRKDFLPLMGWLATLNSHCREEILKYDPQALAFYGDLRNPAVPQAVAEHALTEAFRRVSLEGDRLGRGNWLSTERYWQAGAPRLQQVLLDLFDKYEDKDYERQTLLMIARDSSLKIYRERMLKRSGGDYQKLIDDPETVHYLLDVGSAEDFPEMAKACKAISGKLPKYLPTIVSTLGLDYFTERDIARFVGAVFEWHDEDYLARQMLSEHMLETISIEQSHRLCRALVLQAARYGRRLGVSGAHGGIDHDYFGTIAYVLTSHIKRTPSVDHQRVINLCLLLNRAAAHRSHDTDEFGQISEAIKSKDILKRAFLERLIGLHGLSEDGLYRAVYGHHQIFSDQDLKHVGGEKLKVTRKLRKNLLADAKRRIKEHALSAPKHPDRFEISRDTRNQLRDVRAGLRNASATNELVWAARWLQQASRRSKYGASNFRALELRAGHKTVEAVKAGLSTLWRERAPRFDEGSPRSTYHITIAGLQGLALDLGDGAKLPDLTNQEVIRAVRYGVFEINGFPKWFWKVVEKWPKVAGPELVAMVGEAKNGEVSREHSEALLCSLDAAPSSARRLLAPLAWKRLCSEPPLEEHVEDKMLAGVFSSTGSVRRTKALQVQALKRLHAAYKSEEAGELVGDDRRLRWAAIRWSSRWFLCAPSDFRDAIRTWGPKDPVAVKEFIAGLAAHFGQHHGGELVPVAARNDGPAVLAEFYEWVQWAVNPKDDVPRPDGRVFTPEPRDDAERLRAVLPKIIASGNSQASYDALGRLLLESTDNDAKDYFRHLQMEIRENQSARPPVAADRYVEFEADFSAPVTDFNSFAMRVHTDLLNVKYDVEFGEYSLRDFFSKVSFTRAVKSGKEGDEAALALEVHFQKLVASELNHHAARLYTVDLEPATAENRRRDIKCELEGWKASIELKMSVRWQLEDYYVALEEQLVGQYMRNRNASIGFLVLVLQKDRKWWCAASEQWIRFDGVIERLNRKAAEIAARDRTLFLRVVGVDATTPKDMRERAKAKASRPKSAAAGKAKRALTRASVSP